MRKCRVGAAAVPSLSPSGTAALLDLTRLRYVMSISFVGKLAGSGGGCMAASCCMAWFNTTLPPRWSLPHAQQIIPKTRRFSRLR
jgi:hypothetical protein